MSTTIYPHTHRVTVGLVTSPRTRVRGRFLGIYSPWAGYGRWFITITSGSLVRTILIMLTT